MAPEARVRHGALGPRAAAAARLALSQTSVTDMQDGVAEIKEILLDELDRVAREQFSLGAALQQESSDALRLRVVLIAAHLRLGLMAPLVASTLIAVVALPVWWDKESSLYRKYGFGRNRTSSSSRSGIRSLFVEFVAAIMGSGAIS